MSSLETFHLGATDFGVRNIGEGYGLIKIHLTAFSANLWLFLRLFSEAAMDHLAIHGPAKILNGVMVIR